MHVFSTRSEAEEHGKHLAATYLEDSEDNLQDFFGQCAMRAHGVGVWEHVYETVGNEPNADWSMNFTVVRIRGGWHLYMNAAWVDGTQTGELLPLLDVGVNPLEQAVLLATE